ncbi:MAG: GNAT family N-acetyltransferase [Treponema sp.]|nr:GNAT family N-acetyltransferase [Treponema sp.]
MEVKFHNIDQVDDSLLKYAVIVSRYKGKWIFCKNKTRKWELPGGTREEGEPILNTAKRELYEETGAKEYDIKPICAYSINSYGLLFFAEIKELGDLPDSEIEKIDFFDDIPDELSFPLYHPKHFDKVRFMFEKNIHKELITQRLKLRLLNKNDRELIFKLRSDLNVIQHTGIKQYTNIDEADPYIKKIEQGMEDFSCLMWTINISSINSPIGTLCFWNFSSDKKRAEIGYDLLPEYWGQGYALEAIKAALPFGFLQCGFNCILAYPVEENLASCRVLEKAGFNLIEKKSCKEVNEDCIICKYKINKG